MINININIKTQFYLSVYVSLYQSSLSLSMPLPTFLSVISLSLPIFLSTQKDKLDTPMLYSRIICEKINLCQNLIDVWINFKI